MAAGLNRKILLVVIMIQLL